ncbi:MAG: adenylate/guanylate cyclase domain-containing protein [Planctomycetota bacterium]|nr:adenylate/guanylate cyclase domain-containing protein [Planctomycetota bacterium]
MPDLIAQGPNPSDRWRRPLPKEPLFQPVVLGRTSPGWSVPWDDRISRSHVRLIWNGSRLEVARLIDARNPIFHKGLRQEEFDIGIGDHFVIGQTTFSLVDQRVRMVSQSDEVPALTEHSYAPSQLRQARYRDADRRIEVLSRVPEIISSSSTDEELCARVVNVLMQGIQQASFVAIVGDQPSSEPPVATHKVSVAKGRSSSEINEFGIRLLHWDSRNLIGHQFSPSAQLIHQAIRTRESVLHVWSRGIDASQSYTQSENVDWAFCTPINSEACPGWAIYVAGDFGTLIPQNARDATAAIAVDLQDDLKFAELTATTLGSLRQTRLLQRRQDSLRPFFAPVVQKALATRDPDEVLAPREANVSVLFCDLRGFSRQSEESGDKLLELLRRVSDALGVMTHHILDRNGVVGDFHGDAAMGFWGWPLEQQSSVLQAAQAALAIRAEFEAAAAIEKHALSGFRAGLGIATGRAVAGRIGTVDQVKVTVFGPVVNLASRLESMTKQLRAPILMDEATASRVRKEVSPTIARTRRVARVLPVGMTTPLMVSELLPPEGPDVLLTDAHIVAYEKALDGLQDGNWGEAFRLLHQVPAEDRVKDFLTVFIAQHGRSAPPDWQGFIRLPEK